MESQLAARMKEILDQGGGEGDPRFLPLASLDSGARYGLDAELRWVLAPPEGPPAVIGAANVHLLHEALEQKRQVFDDALEAAARAHELPADDVVYSFPAVALVRAILDKRASYLTRLALLWLHTTELRELRTEILAVTRDATMPGPVKTLAERLVVPL